MLVLTLITFDILYSGDGLINKAAYPSKQGYQRKQLMIQPW